MHFLSFVKFFFKNCLDLILPHCCLACGREVKQGGFVCQQCFTEIDFITEPCCSICGIPFDYADHNSICLDCMQNKPDFDLARAVFLYEGVARKMALAFKYADKIEAVSYFSQLMINAGSIFFKNKIDYIIPVPIHRYKLILRKYNQSALLAREIAKKTGIQISYDALIRNKNTKPQAMFHKKERFNNIKNVFKVNRTEIIKNQNLLLIDDVLTTGATVSECAKIMKAGGAEKVYVLSLARTGLQ